MSYYVAKLLEDSEDKGALLAELYDLTLGGGGKSGASRNHPLASAESNQGGNPPELLGHNKALPSGSNGLFIWNRGQRNGNSGLVLH